MSGLRSSSRFPALVLTACAFVWGSAAFAGGPCPPYVPPDTSGHPAVIPFTDEAIARGLVYVVQPWTISGDHPPQGMGLGIADLNSNGWNDVILMGRYQGRVGIFENVGGTFMDRSCTGTGCPEVGGDGSAKFIYPRGSGIAIADYNADGLLDVYITREFPQVASPPNVLLRNDGDFNFTDVAAAAGVDSTGRSYGGAWGDFDGDGWLDLYLANYTTPIGSPNQILRNKLYRNNANGTFTDQSVKLGVDDSGQTFTAVFTDVNRDCQLDLYIVNDRGHFPPYRPNRLWLNDGGTFTDVSQESGAGIGLFSMSAATGDLTGNGYPDFYITNLPDSNPLAQCGLNPLLLNQGEGGLDKGEQLYTQHCDDAGVCVYSMGWTSMFFDMSNNGRLDLYVVNLSSPNILFANLSGVGGTEQFPLSNVTQMAKISGSNGAAFSAAYGDVTGNGALDVLLNNFGNTIGANVQLYINHEGATRNWIRFNVVGMPGSGNVHALGSNIEVTADGHTQWREIYAGGNNYLSQNELVFHFGLNSATHAEQIDVQWPGCEHHRTLTNYPANHTWTIYPDEMLGDADGNGAINVFDLLALLGNWGAIQPGAERMDMNGDGTINVFDLLLLLGKWGLIE